MKRKAKKLRLSRETLVRLEELPLRMAAGGFDSIAESCPGQCQDDQQNVGTATNFFGHCC
jgi:hypothetical protein